MANADLARLLKLVNEHKPKLVVLDTLADVFGGNEIVRAEARQFIAMLRRLALAHDLAVVLIAHPSLAGMNSGTGASGSTGWSNSVRSRLYLDGIKGENGSAIDPDLRVLTVKKTNYGPPGLELKLRYMLGRFVPVEGQGKPTGFDKIACDTKVERVFLDLLEAFMAQGRDVSPNVSNRYAPAVFEKHPNADGVSKREFGGAMERLLTAQAHPRRNSRAEFEALFQARDLTLRRRTMSLRTAFGRPSDGLRTLCFALPLIPPGRANTPLRVRTLRGFRACSAGELRMVGANYLARRARMLSVSFRKASVRLLDSGSNENKPNCPMCPALSCCRG